MKPPIPVGTAKVAVHGTYNGTTWVNVFYVVVDAGSHTPGDVIAAIAAWFHTLYHDTIAIHAVTSWNVDYVTISYRDAPDSLVRLRVADAIAGTSSSTGEDGQVSYLVNWSTGDPRRGGKPRQYLSGVAFANMLDSAKLTSAFVSGYSAQLLAWLVSGPGLSIPMQLVEMSFRNANAWRTDAHTYPIIGVALNPVVATQRRRVDRVRPS